MRNHLLNIYGILILIIALCLQAISFLSGHLLYLRNPWMFFYIFNFYFGLFISLNILVLRPKLQKWRYYTFYYSAILFAYMFMTLTSVLNFLRLEKISEFDFIIASIIVGLTIIAIVLINRKNEYN